MMYDFTRGCVGALFFVGAVWLAGLVRFAGGFLVALARLVALLVFLFIVGVLEMQKGPNGPLVRGGCFAAGRKLSESNSGSSAATSKAYAPNGKGFMPLIYDSAIMNTSRQAS
jgi:hypothetical protein